MPTIINNIEFNNEFSVETSDFLIGNIGDKISTEIKADATWFSKANVDNEFSFINGENTIVRETGSWADDGFKAGDIIAIVEGNVINKKEATIASISSDGLTLTITGTFGFTEDSITAEAYGVTAITGMNFWYNIIENSDTPDFMSLIDIIEQRFYASGLWAWTATPINFIPQGISQGWVNGSYTVEGQTPITIEDLAFVNGAPAITRTVGSWVIDGYKVGDIIKVARANAANNGIYKILTITALVLTCTTNFGFTETINTTVKVISYQRFEINHTYFINPFFLADQLIQLKAGNPLPDYFLGDKCLKYVYQIDALINVSNPNWKHRFTSEADKELGNTGWFDENFNTGRSKFIIKSCNYTDTITSAVVDAIQYCRKTDIEIKIESSVNAFQEAGYDSTKFTLNHCYLPLNETRYQDTATDFKVNFIFDRALQLAGFPPVNGDYLLFENIQANVVDAKNITITATIDLTALSIDELNLTDRNYGLWVGIQDDSLETLNSDRVAVKCDVNEYICDLDNSDLWICDTKFYQHPYCGFNGKDDLKCWVEDGILSTSIFCVDIGAGTDFNELSDLYVTLEAEHAIHGVFELEKYDFTSAVINAIISGGVQEISLGTTRGFKLKSGHDKNYVKLFRRSDLDAGTKKYYQLDYAFKIRWEDWIYDANVDTDFYDTDLEQNGLNKDWFEKDDKAGWSIKFRVYADVLEPDSENHTTQFKHTSDVSIIDYGDDNDGGDSWTCDITTYDESDNEITPKIQSFANTKIKATFTREIMGVTPVNPYGILEIEEYQVGGIYNIPQTSNLYDTEADSLWISQTNDKRAKVTTDALHVYVESTLNFAKIDQNKNYKLSGRMGNNFPPQLKGDKLWCSGAGGDIIYSANKGVTWNNQTSGVVVRLWSIYFINSLYGWSAGGLGMNTGTIIKTIDGGKNWIVQEDTLPMELFRVYFINSLYGWACGNVNAGDGAIYTTIDGGINWIRRVSGVNKVLRGIYFIDLLNGWCVGGSGITQGIILNTIDGGITWNIQYNAASDYVRDVFFLDSQVGWGAGHKIGGMARIYKTINSGINWVMQAVPENKHLESIYFIDYLHGWVCGEVGIILNTVDGGENWYIQTSGVVDYLHCIKFIDSLNGWCSGIGIILNTVDGGITWSKQKDGGTNAGYDLAII